jgi:CheY-like chemotaxis protein
MENSGDLWLLGDLKSLKDGDTFPQKSMRSIVIAGEMKDCFRMERTIKRLDPSIKVLPVVSSEELLGLLELYVPDLLIMDIQMPCRKGVQCLQEIRESKVYNELPIAIYSTMVRGNRNIASELGANFFFEKPKDQAQFDDILHQLITRQWMKPSGEIDNTSSAP